MDIGLYVTCNLLFLFQSLLVSVDSYVIIAMLFFPAYLLTIFDKNLDLSI